ncbi:MAG: hypothetical protein EXR49_06280 [Dehalococcoidia bacterium]|nr:hypothetical protein [Dehalococcoidia bacterium]
MTPRAKTKRVRGPLTEQELGDGFLRLVSREWRSGEANTFARRVKNAPSLAAPFLVKRLTDGAPRERELATALLSLLEGPRVIAPLRDLLRDTALQDSTRAAAGSVLAVLGEDAVSPAVAHGFADPDAFLADTWEAVFQRAEAEESFREQFIASLEEDGAAGRADVIASLAEPKDPRALLLLLPILHSPRPSTILAALDAIEAIGAPSAVSSLEELAQGDPHPKVRARARIAYGRLIMRGAAIHTPAPRSGAALPLHRACITLLDRSGEQAIVVSRKRPDGLLQVVTVLISDTLGVKACFGVDCMRNDEHGYILETLSRHGLAPVDADPPACARALAGARALSISLRRRLPMDLIIWSAGIQHLAEGPPQQLSLLTQADAEDLLHLLPQTGALLTTSEFRQWYFEPGLVWPYVDEWRQGSMQQQNGDAGQRILAELIAAAAKDLIDDPLRCLLAQRLLRQAGLLDRCGKADLARLSRAAAQGIDPQRGVPLDLHPFVRGMILSSLLNAGLRPPQPSLFPEDFGRSPAHGSPS